VLRWFAALLVGEAVLFYGLWSAWAPLAFVVLGLQIVVGVLASEHGVKERTVRR